MGPASAALQSLPPPAGSALRPLSPGTPEVGHTGGPEHVPLPLTPSTASQTETQEEAPQGLVVPSAAGRA